MQINSCSSLSDSELVTSLGSLVQKHRSVTREVLMHLAEFDRRKLYLGLACPSLFAYCVERLHFSESEAYKRINAARAAQKYPLIYDLLAQGQLHLSAIVVVGPYLSAGNHEEVLRAACGKSRRLVEELIAIRFPKADVQTSLRKVPVKKDLKGEMTREGLLSKSTMELGKAKEPALHIQNQEQKHLAASQFSPEPMSYVTQKPIVPLSEHRYQLKVTLSASTRAKLLQAQNLMRHSNPTGDVETILDKALSVLVQELEAKVCAKPRRVVKQTRCKEKQQQQEAHKAGSTQGQQEQEQQVTPTPQTQEIQQTIPSPQQQATLTPRAKDLQQAASSRAQLTKPQVTTQEPSELSPEIVDGLRSKDRVKAKKSRTIPRRVRREVMQRDGLRCSFQDPQGQRCQATSFLQLHHVKPFACGGPATAANLKVFCSAHNQYQGRLDFGEWGVPRETEP